jgi:hypothetical protein
VIERIVDGRQALTLHGSAMPVWADAFSLSGTPAADQLAAGSIPYPYPVRRRSSQRPV